MPGVYLDTSVLIALLCPEASTDQVMEWYAHSDHLDLVSSPWCRTELASALQVKWRTGQLRQTETTLALDKGLAVLAETRCEAVQGQDFDRAVQLCTDTRWNLRAPDALHLALIVRLGCEALATLDQRMAGAAHDLGLGLASILPPQVHEAFPEPRIPS